MSSQEAEDKLKTTVWSELDKTLKDNLISSVEASLTFNKLLIPSKSKIMKRIKVGGIHRTYN